MARVPSAGLAAVEGVAHGQHGVFTVAQARARGISKDHLDHRVRIGELVAVDYGVYRSVLTPTSWHQRLVAACLAGPAVASHRSAGALWGFPEIGHDRIEVTSLRHRRRTPGDVIWHESYLLDERSVTELDGVPVTAATRTVLDLAAVLSDDALARATDDALRRHLTDVAALRATLERLGPSRPGFRRMTTFLERRERTAVPESDLESVFEAVVRAGGLPAPVPQFPVTAGDGARYRIDFAYPEARIGIELLGSRFHAAPERWTSDIERLGVLSSLGWQMLLFTSEQVRHRTATVVTAIERALRRSGRPLP